MVTYMKDGGFLDEKTGDVSVEINTLNANTNVFSTFKFMFSWEVYNLPFQIP
jgi:hypothetical protein